MRQEIINRMQTERPVPPEGFEARQDTLLNGLIQKEEMKMKKKMSAGLVLALLIMLIAITAFASTNGFGLLELLAARQNSAVLPEANDLVEKNISQASVPCEWADFEIRDAAYDGLNLYLAVVVRPLQDHLILTDGGVSQTADRVRGLGIDGEEKLFDYCVRNNAVALSVSPVLNVEDCDVWMSDWVWEADGSMSCLLISEELPPEKIKEELAITFNLRSMLPMEQPDRENWQFFTYAQSEKQQGMLKFSVKENGVRETVTREVEADFPSVGVSVNRVEMVSTAFGTRVSLDYTVVDAEKYCMTEGGLWFEYMDRDGNRIEGGVIGGGTAGAVDENKQQYRQTEYLTAMEKLPGELTVRAYICWTKERYETRVIDLNAK